MSKLLVFCLDALCSMDIEYMKTLPNFGWIIENGSYVLHAEPIYPSLTYPCHTSILTGNYVNKHGIFHNQKVEVGVKDAPWFNQRSDIQCKTLLDYAKENGYSTCSISWPVTGGAGFDLNMPMIVPIGYTGSNPIKFLKNNATDELLDRYYSKYAHFLIGENRSLDKYTMAIALDIIRDYNQPEIMLIKMCDLDSVRHVNGIDNLHVKDQLNIHDEQLGLIIKEIKSHGDFANTNFVVLGDHGQSDISHSLNINVLLRQHGFIKLDSQNQLVDYDAFCHSASLSAWIQLKNPDDKEMNKKVYNFLLEIKENSKYGIGYVFNKEEVEEKFHLSGPFDFVIEGNKPISFGKEYIGDDVFQAAEYAGYNSLAASHGGLPFKDETSTFFGCGPNINQGIMIERRSIVDEAPTMAAMLGFKLDNIDGSAITEMLR